MRPARFRTVAAAWLCVGCAVRASAESLPPPACVDALRRARFQAEAGEFDAARQGAEAAVAIPACELPALTELYFLLRAGGATAEATIAVGERLAPRLRDPAVPLPRGLLVHLTATPRSRSLDELFVASLSQRLAAAESAGVAGPNAEQVELLSVLSGLEVRLGRLPEARATLERLMALDPSAEWRWQALEIDLALERWQSLAPLIEVMLRATGAPDVLKELYVTVLARLGRYPEMLRRLELLVPTADGDESARERYIELMLEAGWALRDAGLDGEAETLFRRALAADDACEPARLALLHLYGTAEERTAHIAAITARREREEDPDSLFEEGSRLLSVGDAATARGLLALAAPALAGTVFAEAAWYNLGLAAFKLEDWPEAARAFSEAAALNAGRGDTFFQLGVALYRAERCAEAIVPLRRALELLPEKVDAHYFLAACYAATGDSAASAREKELYRIGKPGG